MSRSLRSLTNYTKNAIIDTVNVNNNHTHTHTKLDIVICLPGVTAWQPRVPAHTFNAKLLRSIAPHELRETTNRKSTGTCDKLQQTHPLLVVKLPHTLAERKVNTRERSMMTMINNNIRVVQSIMSVSFIQYPQIAASELHS